MPDIPSSSSATPPPPGTSPPLASSGRIVFYCKDCRKVVEGQKVGRKYAYRCPVCHGKDVAFGTEKSIKSFYHVA